MRLTVLILSLILLFIGFEAFNIGGLISPLFIIGAYLFIMIHIFTTIGLYKNIKFAKKIFLGENMFFVVLICYYMIVIPQLNFGPSSFPETEPSINDYLRSLKYGIIPLIFFFVNIIIVFRLIKESKNENRDI